MKSYFINVSFHNGTFKKFAYAIIKADLSIVNLETIAEEVIRPHLKALRLSLDDVTINVTAFNEV